MFWFRDGRCPPWILSRAWNLAEKWLNIAWTTSNPSATSVKSWSSGNFPKMKRSEVRIVIASCQSSNDSQKIPRSRSDNVLLSFCLLRPLSPHTRSQALDKRRHAADPSPSNLVNNIKADALCKKQRRQLVVKSQMFSRRYSLLSQTQWSAWWYFLFTTRPFHKFFWISRWPNTNWRTAHHPFCMHE